MKENIKLELKDNTKENMKELLKFVKFLMNNNYNLDIESCFELLKNNKNLYDIIDFLINTEELNDFMDIEIIFNLVNAYGTINNKNVKKYNENNYSKSENNKFSEDIILNYLHSLPDHLTADEEREMLIKINNGDKKAKKIFIERNLKLVVAIAKNYVGKGLDFEDLISEGNLGLMKTLEKFDINKGYKFSTYATWWIRQSISRALVNQAKIVRMPVHVTEKINKIYTVKKELTATLKRVPTEKEIADYLNMDVEKVRYLMVVSQDPISLETPIDAEDSTTMGELIADKSQLTPDEQMNINVTNEAIYELLDHLTDREKKVIELRFGLIDGTRHTLVEIGNELGITRERVRQIEEKALRKLRHPSRIKKLK